MSAGMVVNKKLDITLGMLVDMPNCLDATE